MISIIDPHIHYISLAKGQYGWLKSYNPPYWPNKKSVAINVNANNLTMKSPLFLSGVVHIEAGFDNDKPENELAFVQQDCMANVDFDSKTVSYIDIQLAPKLFISRLNTLLRYHSVTGIRYILDEQNVHVLKIDDVRHNLTILAQHNLHFELQANFNNAEISRIIYDTFSSIPTLKTVINHAGFIPHELKSANFKDWQVAMENMASLTSTHLKFSGMEMSHPSYNEATFAQLLARCIDNFSESRVMVASNYPVMLLSEKFADNLLADHYHAYWKMVTDIISREQLPLDLLVNKNAAKFYRFSSVR